MAMLKGTASVPQLGAQSIIRRLARGSSAYALSTLGLRALGFILLAIYSRFLSPEDYGIVSLVETAAVFAAVVAGLGLENGSRRLYFEFVNDPDQLRSYLASVLWLAITSAVATLVVTFSCGPTVLSWAVPHLKIAFFPYFALALTTALASQVLQCRLSIYQCEERISAVVGFSALQSITTTVLTLYLVVVGRRGALGLLGGRALGAVITLAIAGVASWPILYARWQRSYIRQALQLSLPLLLHGLMAAGLVNLDRFILQHFRSTREVGVYSLAYNLGMVMPLFTMAIARAWTPLFFSIQRNGEEGRNLAARIFGDLVLILGSIASVGAILAQDVVRWFVDRRYWEAGKIAPIILGAYFCHSLFMLFQLSVVQAKRTLLVFAVSTVSLAVNVSLNFALIPSLGVYGAAYATLVSYGIELALIAFVAQRVLRMPYGWWRPTVALAGFASILICTQLFERSKLLLTIAALLIAIVVSVSVVHVSNFRKAVFENGNTG